jgi:hypothetical protein
MAVHLVLFTHYSYRAVLGGRMSMLKAKLSPYVDDADHCVFVRNLQDSLFNILPVLIQIETNLHRTFLCKVAYTRYGVPWFISRWILNVRIV